MTSFFRVLATVSLFFLIAAGTASAQSTWQRTFDDQVALNLQSSDPARQDAAMDLLIRVADRRGAGVALRAATAPLLAIYAEATRPSRRLLAVVALSTIDTPAAYSGLLERARTETSPTVRRTILYAVAASPSARSATVVRGYNHLLNQNPSQTAQSLAQHDGS
jgi:uncharacterized membrane protein